MKIVENGSSVELHYKGTFPDGEVFDDSRARGETMNIEVGEGMLIKAFESALLGMSEGETKTINLTADEAYGQPIPEAVVTAPKTAFPDGFPFMEGMPVQGQGPNGEPVRAKIVSFTDTDVTLDHNHPLAGKDINFEIELVQINSSDSFDNYSVKELKAFAKAKGIKGFSTMKKAELVESLSS
jgi:FKBP-type peptidyl-prolyl cis-trans isomerase 2|tara:strand:- start:19 stop:567 length:549 start_codon:yes stop_codon:yes gene_type:complete